MVLNKFLTQILEVTHNNSMANLTVKWTLQYTFVLL